MRVIVACEQSGVVRDAFRRRGHAAWSCDLLPGEGEFAKFHHQCDVRHVLNPAWWDLMIGHPVCKYLANSSSKHLYLAKECEVKLKNGKTVVRVERRKEHGRDEWRWQKMREGAEFFNLLWKADIQRIAIENPIMLGYAQELIGAAPSQVIHPWMYGHPESKGTCFWLKNLPKLQPTNIVEGREQRVWKLPPSDDREKLRSRTFEGVGAAMAAQWGALGRV